ncbi:MAG: metal ABC transporter ATP-binding protein [Opitutia bacterium]
MNPGRRFLDSLVGLPLRALPTLPYAAPEASHEGAWAVEAEGICGAPVAGGPRVLAGVSFRTRRGGRTALVGPNGSGKSTLLRMLAGLVQPSEGSARTLGLPPGTGRPRVAFLAQRPALTAPFPMTLRRLVATGTYAHHGWFEECDHGGESVDRALAMLGLETLGDRQIHSLSGGQLQRALLARATVQGAELLLLDEPYAALDEASRGLVDSHLFSPAAKFTVLMSTHEAGDLSRFDQVLEMGGGRLRERGKGAHGA